MRTSEAGVVRSPLLDGIAGLVHGFTTRELGSMAGAMYAPAEQARHRSRLSDRIGVPLVKVWQVAGADVALVAGGRALRLRDGASAPASDGTPLQADALLTRERGIALAVAAADCVPVAIVTPDGWLGLAHAGWEGTARGVVRALCAALAERSASLGFARAAIGPSIGPCCYTIDRERAAVVRERIGEDDLREREGAFAFDLWRANRRQLEAAGISWIDVSGSCTQDEATRFFSHRGERGKAGRALAFLGWRA